MKEPRHDEERIAALLAGRLEGPERDALLAHLSTADEDYEVFANTAAILREMEEEDAQAEEAGVQVADPPPRREVLLPSVTKRARGWRRSPRWAGTAALVGLVALVMLVLPDRSSRGTPLQMAQALEQPGAGPSTPGWTQPPWDRVRGEGSPVAVQAGALLLRLAVAIQAGDAAATRTLATQIQARYDDQGGSALVDIAARADAPVRELEPLLEEATERLEERFDPADVRLGAWLEAARLAALTRDEGFFRSSDVRAMLGRAQRLAGANADAQAAIEGIRTALSGQEQRDWNDLEKNLEALLVAIGSEQR